MTRCDQCGSAFSHTSGRGGYQPARRFCSTLCKDSASNAARRQPRTYTCSSCGNERVLLHKPTGTMCRTCAAGLGTQAAAQATLNIPIVERIAQQSQPSDTGCWIWKGVLQTNGYGSIHYQGKTRRAHRVSYEAHVGLIPPGMQIDHLCRVRACVNPQHLEPVTAAENQRRAAAAKGATR